MFETIAELARYRELLLNLVIRDLKIRYKNSALGFLWSLINPLVQVATLTIVFKYVMGVKIPNYSAYLLCAFLPWTFFQTSILDASSSIAQYGALVKKTYFPREIIPISSVISNLVHFLMAMVIFFIYLCLLGTPIKVTWLLLPILIIIQVMLTTGISLFAACLNVYYEDIKYVTAVLLNLLFYLNPVVYLVEQALNKGPMAIQPIAHAYFYLSPISYLLVAYRKILLPAFNAAGIRDIPISYGYLGIAALTSFCILVAGYAFYNKRKWYFAERF